MFYRRYEKADEGSLTSLLQECFQLFKSEPMFKLLTKFTGLKLSNVDIDEKNDKENGENTDETSSEDQVNVSLFKKGNPSHQTVFNIKINATCKCMYSICV